MKQIVKHFHLSKNPEVTIEMNPGTVSEQKIATYKRAGINRFSVGLQTAIDEQLQEIGRIHGVRDYLYTATLLKGENFSADIMLGLKGQTQEDVKKTVEVVAASGAKHVSMYALTPEDGTPIYTDYLNGELPDSDEVASLYEYGRKLLQEKGYARYEVSNFAKKGYESRHNLNYWRRGEYIGMGLRDACLTYRVRHFRFRLQEGVRFGLERGFCRGVRKDQGVFLRGRGRNAHQGRIFVCAKSNFNRICKLKCNARELCKSSRAVAFVHVKFSARAFPVRGGRAPRPFRH